MTVSILFVAIGSAGVLKLLALDEFAMSLQTWNILPQRAIVPTSLIIPVLELIVCVAWFLYARRRMIIEAITFAAILVVTGIYAFQAWTSEPPSCGCLGLWQSHYDQIATSQALVWRNGVILALLAVSIITRIVKGAPRAPQPRVHTA